MDAPWLPPLVASVVAAVLAAGVSYLVALKFQKLGGGDAQLKLNKILTDTAATVQQEMDSLRRQFAGCKDRLIEVEGNVDRLGRERIDLKQQIDDLHDEVRELRRTAASKGRSQDARDVRQDDRGSRQDVRAAVQDERSIRLDPKD